MLVPLQGLNKVDFLLTFCYGSRVNLRVNNAQSSWRGQQKKIMSRLSAASYVKCIAVSVGLHPCTDI